MNERAVSFANPDGLTLHGVLHLPPSRTSVPLGVVLLSPGQKCRVGPWRSYVLLARRIASAGVPVLRFDFHGLGDSDGVHAHGQALVDFNGFVQSGGLAGDVDAATTFFARECGVRHFLFAGMCAGASSGLLAAERIPGLYGHVLVDLPVTLSNSDRQKYLERHPVELLRLRDDAGRVWTEYLSKLFDAKAWGRVLTGRSDYRLLLESARQALLRWLLRRSPASPLQPPLPTPPTRKTSGERGGNEILNEPLVRAFHRARSSNQKIFFLNSSAYHPTFQAYFANQHLPHDRSQWRGLGLLVVPDSNHILTAEHAQRALFETVDEFICNALADLAAQAPWVQSADSHGASWSAR